MKTRVQVLTLLSPAGARLPAYTHARGTYIAREQNVHNVKMEHYSPYKMPYLGEHYSPYKMPYLGEGKKIVNWSVHVWGPILPCCTDLAVRFT